MTSDACVFSVPAVVDVESVAGAVGEVDLQPAAVDVVHHDGARALTEPSEAEGQGSCRLVAKLTAHHLHATKMENSLERERGTSE